MFAMFANDVKTTAHESSDEEFQICRESLDALDLRTRREAPSASDDNKKGWIPLTRSGSEASTPTLTDCSSRSSLTECLDLSIESDDDYGFQDFKDPPATPTGMAFLTPLSSPDRVRSQSSQLSYLPSILRQQPPQSRSVSFSGLEEIFGGDSHEIGESNKSSVGDGGLVYPTTPAHQWYSSKHSYRKEQQLPYQPRLAHPPLASKPRQHSQVQPRRSALKQSDGNGATTSNGDLHASSGPVTRLGYPASPKILWYSKG